jgi:hypothetical protein
MVALVVQAVDVNTAELLDQGIHLLRLRHRILMLFKATLAVLVLEILLQIMEAEQVVAVAVLAAQEPRSKVAMEALAFKARPLLLPTVGLALVEVPLLVITLAVVVLV